MKSLTKLALAVLLVASGLAGCSEQSADSVARAKVVYVASANRAPFHRITCKWGDRISPQNLQTFQTKEQAIKAGHRPCKVCKP
jgi:methylphosphotriester-DNA--protein-cysteine methyltransferase